MAQSVAHAEGQAAPASGATSKADRLSPAEMAERVRAELLEGPVPGAGLVCAGAQAVGAAQIAERAKAELSRITGLDADHVSGVRPDADGWQVTVDLIELRRIPASTDVLAAYEAVFAPTGVLMSYRRTRRYFRDQMLEE
jgi:Gas vesicle synthesis protein GvpO